MIFHVSFLGPFILPFRKLVDEQFPDQNHQFWLLGGSTPSHEPIEECSNTLICKRTGIGQVYSYFRLVVLLHRAKKVMLHGLFNPRVVIILALCPWLLNKCYWVILGGDLYQYAKAANGWRSRIKEPFRRFVIRRLGHLVTYIEGDVELARKWYDAKGVHHECLMYLSNVVNPSTVALPCERPEKNGLDILLGNSADPSNNHLEAMERLLPYKDQEIKIYAPLSYGDQDHAQRVIQQGQKWFGNKFVPITDFMPFDQYIDFLKNLDIAIFNHQRQQAMGNTITLLGMGKTVYLRNDVSQWELFQKEKVAVLDITKVDLQLLDSQTTARNVERVRQRFSRQRLIEQYSRIFKS